MLICLFSQYYQPRVTLENKENVGRMNFDRLPVPALNLFFFKENEITVNRYINYCYFCLSDKHSAQQPFFVLCFSLIFWSCVCFRIVVSNTYCVVFLRLVYPMLPVSLDCTSLIAPSVFSNVIYLHLRQVIMTMLFRLIKPI